MGRGILIALAVLTIVTQAAVITGAAWAAANPRIVADNWTVWTTELDPAVAEYAVRAGVSDDGAFLLQASFATIVPASEFDDYCPFDEPGIGVLGCYTLDDGRIYLFDVENPELASLEPVVAAHEMLHAAWDRMTRHERQVLVAPIESVFAALGPDHELVERIAAYEAVDPRSRIPELYAILGSEIADAEVDGIGPELAESYSRYFDDRQKVIALNADVVAVFAALEERLAALNAELETLAASIQAEQTAYAADAAVLEADITAFNERAARVGGYTSRSQFLRDRDALIVRQDALEARLAETNALVEQYNTLLADLEALNAEAEELNRSINVELVPIEQQEGMKEPTGG